MSQLSSPIVVIDSDGHMGLDQYRASVEHIQIYHT